MSSSAKVIAKSGLYVRMSAGVTSQENGAALPYNTTITTTGETKSVLGVTWYKISAPKTGWVSGQYIKFPNGSTGSSSQPGNTVGNKKAPNKNPNQTKGQIKKVGALTPADIGSIAMKSKTTQGYEIKNMVNVFGLPFHFHPDVDIPPGDKSAVSWKNAGTTFIENYLGDTPIAIFIPGVPDFLTSVSIGDKNKMVTLLSRSDTAEINRLGIKAGDGKMLDYFTVKPALTIYYEYVNSLCGMTARMMGIGEETYYGRKLKNFDWGWFAKDPTSMGFFKKLVNGDKAVVFAYDPMSGLSDSLSNSTTESQLSQGAKGISAKAREAEFIFGVGAGVKMEYAADDNIEQQMIDLTDLKSNDPMNVWKRIAGLGKTVTTGSNLKFPELYSDSQYSRSYNLDFKFKSPYADQFSKFLYIMVPFWHIFCLAAPRSTSTVSYASPLLIRGYSKGAFSIDAGILDSITFKKFGNGEAVSEDGIPTEIEVSVSIRDLYQSLSITPFKINDMQNFFANSGLIDLMGSMTGVDMTRFGFINREKLYLSGFFQDLYNSPGRVYNQTIENLKNLVEPLIGR